LIYAGLVFEEEIKASYFKWFIIDSKSMKWLNTYKYIIETEIMGNCTQNF